jgi:zinc transporter, ZIP family
MPIHLIITLAVAGPILGSLFGVWKSPSEKSINIILSFAAGSMLAISLFELMPQSAREVGFFASFLALLAGLLLMWLLDLNLPHIHPDLDGRKDHAHDLKRATILLLAGIFLHNIPEGFAIGIGASSDLKTSLVIVLALALHDIPEAICTSAPYYFVTKKRVEAFLVSASTVIPTIAGIFFIYYFTRSINAAVVSLMTAATAGLMIYITIFELIPATFKKGAGYARQSAGLAAGLLAVMAIHLFV